MEAVFYIFAKVVSLMLSAISLSMLVRVILELVSRMTSYDAEGSKVFAFCLQNGCHFIIYTQID